MARAESIAGGGPLSGGSESLGRVMSAGALGAGVGAPAALASLLSLQATKVIANESNKTGRETIFIDS
jgi:hypothetical protein